MPERGSSILIEVAYHGDLRVLLQDGAIAYDGKDAQGNPKPKMERQFPKDKDGKDTIFIMAENYVFKPPKYVALVQHRLAYDWIARWPDTFSELDAEKGEPYQSKLAEALENATTLIAELQSKLANYEKKPGGRPKKVADDHLAA